MLVLDAVGLIGVGAMYLAYATSQPNPDPELVKQWNEMREGFAPLSGQELADKLALFQGPWSGITGDSLSERRIGLRAACAHKGAGKAVAATAPPPMASSARRSIPSIRS